MGSVKVTGRLWFETEGEGPGCPHFVRRRWEPVEFEVDEKYMKKPPKDQWSILTEAGETFEP